MSNVLRSFMVLGVICSVGLACTGCLRPETTGEKIERKTRNAADDVGDAADNAVDKTGKAIKHAGERIEDAN